jgi:hypothetical protein
MCEHVNPITPPNESTNSNLESYGKEKQSKQQYYEKLQSHLRMQGRQIMKDTILKR